MLDLSDAQKKELDLRLDEMDRDSTLGIPWDQVLKQIREPFELGADDEARLVAAMAEAEQGSVLSASEVLRELRTT